MERLAGLISTNKNNKKFGKLISHRPIAAIPFYHKALNISIDKSPFARIDLNRVTVHDLTGRIVTKQERFAALCF